MFKVAFFTVVLAVLGTTCTNSADHDVGSNTALGSSALVGRISSKAGPWSNTQVKLKWYRDDNCRNLSRSNTKLSPEEEKFAKECISEKATAETDDDGSFIFSEVEDGWYSLDISRDSNDDPWKSFPWHPFFVTRQDDGSTLTLIAAKEEPRFRMSVFGKPFQFSKADPERKDIVLSIP